MLLKMLKKDKLSGNETHQQAKRDKGHHTSKKLNNDGVEIQSTN